MRCHYCNGDLLPNDVYEIENLGWHTICYSCLSDSSSGLLPQYTRDPECPHLSIQEYEAMSVTERRASQASLDKNIAHERGLSDA